MNATVSVGMPCYNAEQWIERALDSILSQTRSVDQLIVSDNASTDRTWAIVSHYASLEPRIRAVRNERNLGASANFNRVFELASGTYFKWASSNDICAPTLVESCAAVLDREQEVVGVCPRAVMFEEDPYSGVEYSHGVSLDQADPVMRFIGALKMQRNVAMLGLIRAEALRRTELIRPYYGSDVVMIAALALQGRFLELPDALLYMRDDVRTATARMSRQERDRHFTGQARRMRNQSVRNLAGYIRAVATAPVGMDVRLRLVPTLLRMVRWSVPAIVAEAKEALKSDPAAGGRAGSRP